MEVLVNFLNLPLSFLDVENKHCAILRADNNVLGVWRNCELGVVSETRAGILFMLE